jgi:N-acetylglucosaminyldiphosphoundecaprenol N-acetyl-beta-D-mannosaminyltransferase
MRLPLPFWKGNAAGLLREMNAAGGFLVVPSAPSLCQASMDPVLWQAHLNADHAVVDSGYLRLLLLACGETGIPRISGHQIVELMLKDGDEAGVSFRDRKLLWIVPTCAEEARIKALLDTYGFSAALGSYYVAPDYRNDSDFCDENLADHVNSVKPDWVILCIGGGRQEKLGAYLRKKFGRRPVILATGGAIAFFSGGQAPIPRWADRLYLGWLVRTLHDPAKFAPRYLKAIMLPLAFWRLRKHREKSPALGE